MAYLGVGAPASPTDHSANMLSLPSQAAEISPQDARSPAWRTALLATICAIGILQYFTPLTVVHWLYILQRAYYIPIVLAGLWWGWKHGLAVALLSGAAFAIGTPSIWNVRRVDVLDQCLEIGVFCLVGLTSGILSDRQRSQERDLQKTTHQLLRTHLELQDNFENMKRSERLSALGQLAAGLAHEIRNPLASIEGAAAILQRENRNEERRIEFLEIIQKESRRLDGLLTRFLKFAKPPEPNLRSVEVGELLDAVTSLAQHAIPGCRLEIFEDVQPGLTTLQCDLDQMKQVLLNLVINAVQAMPEGGRVRLAMRQDENRITIDVEDEGSGVSQENVERVFDPFFTTKASGTGLGLPVADQIVRQHAGTLTISRNTARGATFRISLPLRPTPAHDQEQNTCC